MKGSHRALVSLLVSSALGSGCLSADVVECDGVLCPAGMICSPLGDGCLRPDQVSACNNHDDGDGCSFPGVSSGFCRGGVCFDGDCGDGILTAPEQCEAGNLDGADCSTLGFYEAPGLACADDCTFDTSACVGSCGDGLLNGAEDCDDAGTLTPDDDVFAGNCQDLGFYDATTIACTSSCRFDVSSCTGFCGDRVLNGTETCEGMAPAGLSCIDLGFESGSVDCNEFCTADVSRCESARWSTMITGTSEHLEGVWGNGASDVFAVGAAGTILRFDGSAWTPMSSGTTATLNAVWGTGSTDVFAVGNAVSSVGTILHWDGATWSAMTAATTYHLFGVWGTGPSDVFAVGELGNIRRWNGSTWVAMASGTTAMLLAVWGTGPNDVFVVGTNGTIRHWNGTAWSSMTSGTTEHLYGIGGTGPADVYAVGANGTLLHWNGTAWSAMTSGTTQRLDAVWAAGPADVFAVGPNTTLRSTGTGWTTLATTAAPLAVWGSSAGNVFAVGSNGVAQHWSGAVWLPSSLSPVRSISGSGPDDVWAVGVGEIILHWDGSTWTPHFHNAMGYSLHPLGVASQSAERAVVVGLQIILSCFAATPECDVEQAFSGPTLQSVWAWGPDLYEFVAVGIAGANMGSGSHLETTTTLYGVWGPDAGEAFVVGDGGTIFHWDGTTWSQMSSGTTEDLYGVWGAGPADVFVVGTHGTILHWNGAAWSPMTSDTTLRLWGVSGTGPNDIFVVGDDGTILHWDGLAWSPMSAGNATMLFGVWTGDSVYAAGDSGILRRYRDCGPSETACSDDADNDCDGRIDCADLDCAADTTCQAGGLCEGFSDLACGATIAGSMVGAPTGRMHAYTCDPWREFGRERVYRVVPSASGPVTATLSDLAVDLDLVVLAEGAGGGCDPYNPSCLGASSTSASTENVTFTAEAGVPYYVVVDGYVPNAGSFSLSVTCP